MPAFNDGKGNVVKVSFTDIFKSSKTLREEMAAAALKVTLLDAILNFSFCLQEVGMPSF
jgi:hypothetical protein